MEHSRAIRGWATLRTKNCKNNKHGDKGSGALAARGKWSGGGLFFWGIQSEEAICEGLILFWFRRWYQRLKGAVLLRALIDCEEVQQQQQQQQLIDISRLAATTGKVSCCHNFVIVTSSLASNRLHIIADAAAAPQLQVRSVKMQSPNFSLTGISCAQAA